MPLDQLIKAIFLAIIVLGLGALIYVVGFFAGDKNTLDSLQKKIPVIFGATFSVVLLLAIFSYIYLRSNTQAFVPFVIIMTFLNFELCLLAVSTATIQKA